MTRSKLPKVFVEEIKAKRHEAESLVESINAQTAADNPEEANQAVQNVRTNPEASLTDQAIASALSLQQQGKTDEAIEKWRALAHITEGSDNDLAARAWVSVAYLLKDKDLKSCVSANDEAIRLNPDYAVAYNNRGIANGDLGQYEAAIADYDQAVCLNPGFAEAYLNRADAKATLKLKDEARKDFEITLELARNAKLVAEAMQALRDLDDAEGL